MRLSLDDRAGSLFSSFRNSKIRNLGLSLTAKPQLECTVPLRLRVCCYAASPQLSSITQLSYHSLYVRVTPHRIL
jgi:hypothetical protein